MVISEICRRLCREGLKVLPIKHIPHKDFTMIRNGKDTSVLYYNCRSVGYMSDSGETGIIIRKEISDIVDFCVKVRNMFNYDLIVLEGFSRKVSGNDEIPKIVCVKELKDLEHFNPSGMYIACSLREISREIVKIPEEIEKIVNFVRTFIKIFNIYEKLPKIDCRKCGYTCWRMAEKIYRGEKTIDDCRSLQSNVKLIVNGSEISLNEFVQKLYTNVIIGLVRSLKGVPNNIRDIRIEVKLQGDMGSCAS